MSHHYNEEEAQVLRTLKNDDKLCHRRSYSYINLKSNIIIGDWKAKAKHKQSMITDSTERCDNTNNNHTDENNNTASLNQEQNESNSKRTLITTISRSTFLSRTLSNRSSISIDENKSNEETSLF